MRFVCRFCEAGALIMFAFDVNPIAIKGPRWLMDEVYRVEITTSAPVSRAQMMRLLQPVIVSAFHLRYRVKSKPTLVYRLGTGPHGAVPAGGVTESKGGPGAGVREFPSVEWLVRTLNSLYYEGSPAVRHPVEDATGRSGNHRIELDLGPGNTLQSVGVFKLIKKQLGLSVKLVPGHTRHFEVEHINRLHGAWTSAPAGQ